MLKFKVIFFLLLIGFLSLTLLVSGCAGLKEGVRGFFGISTRALEKARKGAIVKNFNYDYFTCYSKTLDALKEIKSFVYAKDMKKQMIAIYVSETNTTPVGIFFKDIDENNTQVEVSSRSTQAKELIAVKLFAALKQKSATVK